MFLFGGIFMKLLDDEFFAKICSGYVWPGEVDMLEKNRNIIFYEKVEKPKICAHGCSPLVDGYNVYLLDQSCYRLIRDGTGRVICDALDSIELWTL